MFFVELPNKFRNNFTVIKILFPRFFEDETKCDFPTCASAQRHHPEHRTSLILGDETSCLTREHIDTCTKTLVDQIFK